MFSQCPLNSRNLHTRRPSRTRGLCSLWALPLARESTVSSTVQSRADSQSPAKFWPYGLKHGFAEWGLIRLPLQPPVDGCSCCIQVFPRVPPFCS
ncbi:hypothetical protein FA13DRAFT_198681 [Coprinellus micaceus]|uniref:Uncharacterized protein n=1 Tax=Coprinellus micaceus TaxID=71717 RepID=A0A4Y7TH45_COPMI|nr:hypothetical protein FA13DRAFT_198681 [Coprinellus micaceus]